MSPIHDLGDQTRSSTNRPLIHREFPNRQDIEAFSWIIAIGAAFLPAAGYLIRLFAFYISSVNGDKAALASSASVAQLAATGAANLFGSPGLALLVFALFWFTSDYMRARPSARSVSVNKEIAILSVVILVAFLICSFIPFGPEFPISILAVGVAGIWVRYVIITREKLNVTALFPALIALLAGIVLYGAMGGNIPGTEPSKYQFGVDPPSRAPDSGLRSTGRGAQWVAARSIRKSSGVRLSVSS